MGCEDIKRVIYFFLDGTLGDAKLREISRHIDDCPNCGMRARIQKRLRQFIRRRLAPVSAPERFKVRLSRSLRAVIHEL
jgi:mycothiol system anti-sigma-R factor